MHKRIYICNNDYQTDVYNSFKRIQAKLGKCLVLIEMNLILAKVDGAQN